MSTVLEITEDIIVNHEKQSVASVSDVFKATVAEAVNRAIRYLYNYMDWTFRVAYVEDFEYDPTAESPLPSDFLSFNQTGAVFYKLSEGGTVQRELIYKELPVLLRMMKGPNPLASGNPIYFSLGGPLAGVTNQRELLLYPSVACWLDLIYQAVAPGPYTDGGTTWDWEDEIARIPVAWHYVIREMTIIFRLIDKEGDSSRYQDMLKTCMKTMAEQEPHGRENPNIVLPKKLAGRMTGMNRGWR